MVSNRLSQFEPVERRQAAILVVEDDRETAELLARRAWEFFEMPAVLAGSLLEANAFLDECSPRVVLLDLLLPDGDGAELMLRLQRNPARPAVATITGVPSLYQAMVALRTRAVDFLVKPFNSESLKVTFERLARRLTEQEEQDRLRERLTASDRQQEQLRRKIDILCKDLVNGYQKLLVQVVQDKK